MNESVKIYNLLNSVLISVQQNKITESAVV